MKGSVLLSREVEKREKRKGVSKVVFFPFFPFFLVLSLSPSFVFDE